MEGTDPVKILKLIVGILCIVLALFVAFQTFFLGPGNAFFPPLELNRTLAIGAIAVFFLGGIIMASTDGSQGAGGEVICIILFTLATIFTVVLCGRLPDLRLWAWICFGLDAVNLFSLIGSGRSAAALCPSG